MTNWLKKRFEGRMGRKEFLFPGLVLVVLLISVIIFTFLVIRSNKSIIVGCLFLIPFLILFIPAITKRLHDIRLSGWICLAWFLITPIALYGYVISLYLLVAGTDSVFALSTETVRLLSLILSTVHILTILLLLFKPSTKTTNKYGPVPVSYTHLTLPTKRIV